MNRQKGQRSEEDREKERGKARETRRNSTNNAVFYSESAG